MTSKYEQRKRKQEYERLLRESDRWTKSRNEYEEKMRAYRQRAEKLNREIQLIKKGHYLKNDTNTVNIKQPSLKERMNQETEWELLKILAMEDYYTVRHYRGKTSGIECYAVMLGGTVLSTHLDKHEALENWNAWLNGECAANCDDLDFDDF